VPHASEHEEAGETKLLADDRLKLVQPRLAHTHPATYTLNPPNIQMQTERYIFMEEEKGTHFRKELQETSEPVAVSREESLRAPHRHGPKWVLRVLGQHGVQRGTKRLKRAATAMLPCSVGWGATGTCLGLCVERLRVGERRH
jgi:hypothetical protein